MSCRLYTFLLTFCLLGASSLFAAWHPQQLSSQGAVYQQQQRLKEINYAVPGNVNPVDVNRYFCDLRKCIQGLPQVSRYLFDGRLNIVVGGGGSFIHITLDEGYFVNAVVLFTPPAGKLDGVPCKRVMRISPLDCTSIFKTTDQGLLFEKTATSVCNGEPFYIIAVGGLIHYVSSEYEQYVTAYQHAGPFTIDGNNCFVSVQQQNVSTPMVASAVASTQPATVLPVAALGQAAPATAHVATPEEQTHLGNLLSKMQGLLRGAQENLHTVTQPNTSTAPDVAQTVAQITLPAVSASSEVQALSSDTLVVATATAHTPSALPSVAKLPVTTVCDTKAFPTIQETAGKASSADSVPTGAWGKPVAAQQKTPMQVAPQAAQTAEKVIQSVPEKHEKVAEILPAQPRTLVTSKEQTGKARLSAKERAALKKQKKSTEQSQSPVAVDSTQQFPALTTSVVPTQPLSASAKKRLARLQAEEEYKKQEAAALAAQTAQAAAAAFGLATKKTVESKGKNAASTIKTKKGVNNQAVFAKWDAWFEAGEYNKICDAYEAKIEANEVCPYSKAPLAFLLHACLVDDRLYEAALDTCILYTLEIKNKSEANPGLLTDDEKALIERDLQIAQRLKKLSNCTGSERCSCTQLTDDIIKTYDQDGNILIVLVTAASHKGLVHHGFNCAAQPPDPETYQYAQQCVSSDAYRKVLLSRIALLNEEAEAEYAHKEQVSSSVITSQVKYVPVPEEQKKELQEQCVALLNDVLTYNCSYVNIQTEIDNLVAQALEKYNYSLDVISVVQAGIEQVLLNKELSQAQKDIMYCLAGDMHLEMQVLKLDDINKLNEIIDAEIAQALDLPMTERRFMQRLARLVRGTMLWSGADRLLVVDGFKAVLANYSEKIKDKDQKKFLASIADNLEPKTHYMDKTSSEKQVLKPLVFVDDRDAIRTKMFESIIESVVYYDVKGIDDVVKAYLEQVSQHGQPVIHKEMDHFEKYFLRVLQAVEHPHALVSSLSRIARDTQDAGIATMARRLWIRLSAALDVYHDFKQSQSPEILEHIVNLEEQWPVGEFVDDVINPALSLCKTPEEQKQMIALLRAVVEKNCIEPTKAAVLFVLDNKDIAPTPETASSTAFNKKERAAVCVSRLREHKPFTLKECRDILTTVYETYGVEKAIDFISATLGGNPQSESFYGHLRILERDKMAEIATIAKQVGAYKDQAAKLGDRDLPNSEGAQPAEYVPAPTASQTSYNKQIFQQDYQHYCDAVQGKVEGFTPANLNRLYKKVGIPKDRKNESFTLKECEQILAEMLKLQAEKGVVILTARIAHDPQKESFYQHMSTLSQDGKSKVALFAKKIIDYRQIGHALAPSNVQQAQSSSTCVTLATGSPAWYQSLVEDKQGTKLQDALQLHSVPWTSGSLWGFIDTLFNYCSHDLREREAQIRNIVESAKSYVGQVKNKDLKQELKEGITRLEDQCKAIMKLLNDIDKIFLKPGNDSEKHAALEGYRAIMDDTKWLPSNKQFFCDYLKKLEQTLIPLDQISETITTVESIVDWIDKEIAELAVFGLKINEFEPYLSIILKRAIKRCSNNPELLQAAIKALDDAVERVNDKAVKTELKSILGLSQKLRTLREDLNKATYCREKRV